MHDGNCLSLGFNYYVLILFNVINDVFQNMVVNLYGFMYFFLYFNWGYFIVQFLVNLHELIKYLHIFSFM